MAVVCGLLMLTLAVNQAFSVSYDPLKIAKPDIAVVAEKNGNIGLLSGNDGDILVNPGLTGSVFFEGEDLLYLIEVIQSLPPLWQSHGPVLGSTPSGYLGAFHAGDRLNLQLSAVDPEGLNITYARVAGDFPPGISINSHTGVLSGIVPDADATYVITIRATDGHGKYADNAFKMVVRGYDSCATNPCKYEGVCHDERGGYQCQCISPHGGKTCNLDCRNNPLGVQQSLKYVSNAQMTGYKMLTSSNAYSGRLHATSTAWSGVSSNSYLQIALDNVTDIYGISSERYSASYYVGTFYMQYSIDGNMFYNYTDYTGATVSLTGTSSTGVHTDILSQVMTAKYVRLFPLSWNSSYSPYFRVELLGCYPYKYEM